MKRTSMWITLGMSLSIVLCTGLIAPANAEQKKIFDGTTTIACFAGIMLPSQLTTTQPKPQSGTKALPDQESIYYPRIQTMPGNQVQGRSATIPIPSDVNPYSVNQNVLAPPTGQGFKTISEGEEVEF